jgi:ATP-GRASP peptide maturase of grasp-with-spasm system
MIVILSNFEDVSTDIVEKHLQYNNLEYARLDAEDVLHPSFTLDFEKGVITTSKYFIDVSNVEVVWYRKFGFVKKDPFYKELNSDFKVELIEHLVNEHYVILEAIIDLFSNKKWLTNPKHTRLNKLTVLRQARSVGLQTPKSYLVNSKIRINEIMSSHKLISKSVFEALFFDRENYSFSMFTKEVTPDMITNLPNHFFPSLVQQQIDKEVEIRVFLLQEKCFAMAIFSQSSQNTSADYRTVNWEKPIRFVPFSLPNHIELKLFELTRSLGLNCCSIDLIKNADEYYFLEVNAVGEFGMVSFPCNYNIHYHISETLKNMSKNDK